MINGVTKLLMMKADVLNGFPTIKICSHYQMENGDVTDTVPYEIVHEKIVPIYREVKGWNCSLDNISLVDLPTQLIAYVELLETELGLPITLISTGPDRTETIFRE